MNPAEKFQKFASECEVMAKFARSPERAKLRGAAWQ